MAKQSEQINHIPVRTWNWLGVNESTLAVSLPAVTEYRKQSVCQAGGTKVKITEISACRDVINRLETENRLKAGASDATSVFAATYFNSGYFIETAPGEKCEKPVVLQYELDEENPVLVDQHFIYARENSELTVVIRYSSQAGSKAYHNGLTKIVACAGAVVRLIKVQLLAGDAYHIDAVGTAADEQSVIDCTLIELGAQQIISNCQTRLAGAGSAGNINSIYFGDKHRQIDIHYQLSYQARETVGEIKARGALLDQSKKTFRGTLDFIKGASGARGKEEEYAVLLSPEVRNRSIPLMLCSEDAVEGQHAASAGKVDENKLFYLMSRGLSETEAKKLVIEAAFQPILAEVPLAALKEEISNYVQGRLSHVQ
ncbi:hypothetical protein EV210_103189 [Anaerospora hongkongensis]|uniref:SUF system FeS cluster assembly SufBD core domain-containing protein n=1 Tax=Anaerospora hongkongensis TaxID=244830 RepID=A0A4R1Q2E4_9FIRM|nr:Fe-S cluster assembly protein SufD [Anaerospora hongkongensis]TCL38710.1 hypothetical protein EV210_103189 [Anaerospora hongkongensis]